MSWLNDAKVITAEDKAEQAKQAQRQQIEDDFRAEIEPVIEGYTQAEIDSWSFQAEEAGKVKRGEPSNALTKLAEGRGKGETPEQVADKILNNRAIFEDVFFTALAKKQRRIEELEA